MSRFNLLQGLLNGSAARSINSPTYVANFNTNGVAGLCLRVNRDTKPATWDKAGWLRLVVYAQSPTNNIHLLSTEVIIGRWEALMIPQTFEGSTCLLEFRPVDWIEDYTFFWGRLVVAP